jgi:hypothetical protein
MGDAPEAKETPQQRAAAETAMAAMKDYRARWLPLQRQLAEDVRGMGSPDSAERRQAAGKATTDSAIRFGEAKGQVEGGLTAAGAGAGSGKFKAAVAGMGNDEATSRGLGMVAADQAIDDAYLQGLGQIAAMGKGERGGALQGMGDIARMSGQQAAQDAQLSGQRRAGNAQMVGQLAGFGLSGGFGSPSMDGMQAKFSQTGMGASGFGTGLAYGNQDIGGFI